MGDTMAGLRYARGNATVRRLAVGTFVFVTFAGIDNVALVFLVKGPLHGTSTEYGLVAATFGVGMIGASVALSVFAARRPAALWLIGGVIIGGAGAVLSGLAPDIAVGCVGQVIGGVGNTADLVGTDTLIQQHVPPELLGRAYGIVYGGDQLASIGSTVIAAPLIALARRPRRVRHRRRRGAGQPAAAAPDPAARPGAGDAADRAGPGHATLSRARSVATIVFPSSVSEPA